MEEGGIGKKPTPAKVAKAPAVASTGKLDLSSVKKGSINVMIIANEQYSTKMGEIAQFFSKTFAATTYVSLNKLLN